MELDRSSHQAAAAFSSCVSTTAFAGAAAAVRAARTGHTVTVLLLGREKLVDWELKIGKDCAGILLSAASAAVGAIAPRQTDIERGHQQLDIALQADD